MYAQLSSIVKLIPDFGPELDPVFQVLIEGHFQSSGADLQSLLVGVRKTASTQLKKY
jgi:hypothetical protein